METNKVLTDTVQSRRAFVFGQRGYHRTVYSILEKRFLDAVIRGGEQVT